MNEVFLSLSDRVASHGKWYGVQQAVQFGSRSISWAELDERASRVAAGLRAAGLEPGDHVGIILGNCLEYAEVIVGIVRAGCCCTPLSGMLSPEILARLAAHGDVKALIASHTLLPLVSQAVDEPAMPPLKLRALQGGQEEGWLSYDSWIAQQTADTPRVRIDPDAMMTLLYSSGTTGEPKGIAHTYRTRNRIALNSAQFLRIDRDSTTIITTSMYTNGTWMTLIPTLMMGGRVVIMEHFDVAQFLQLSEECGATTTFLVPSQIAQILDHPQFSDARLSFTTIFCSGSPLPLDLRGRVLEAFGADIIEAYGLTEGFGTRINIRRQPDKFGSVGKITPGGDLVIIGQDGSELPAGEVGEIAGFSDVLMSGYYKDASATAATFWTAPDGRDFLLTGDLGYLDEDGFLFLKDRAKDLIISGGLNIYASDIEAVLRRYDEVRDVAVIGVPHPRWGETPVAIIESRTQAASSEAASLCEAANGQLAKYQRLAKIFVVDALPRNALGKILKRELRDQYVDLFSQTAQ